MLFWERENGILVVDGQQRLAAMGVPMTRWTGEAVPLPASYLDLEGGGTWNAEPTPGLPCKMTFAEVADPFRIFSAGGYKRCSERLAVLWGQAAERVRQAQVVYAMSRYCAYEDVIHIFRTINTPGVLFSDEDIERLIREAGADWAPPVRSTT